MIYVVTSQGALANGKIPHIRNFPHFVMLKEGMMPAVHTTTALT
jgi:predicted RNA-binding protein with RPS1 domain